MANFSCSHITQAVINNDIVKLNELIQCGKNINVKDNLGFTPLHIAVKLGNHECIDILLNHPDCEINDQTFEGYTSLYIACEKPILCIKSLRIIKTLLHAGADPKIANNEQLAPIHLACKNGDLDVVKLLFKYNIEINYQDFDGYTPLHFAVTSSNLKVVEYLIKKNADCNIREINGLNPLMFAIFTKENEIACTLIPFTNDLNCEAEDGNTAITLAIKGNNVEIFKELMNKNVYLKPSDWNHYNIYDNFEMFQYVWNKFDTEVLIKKFDFQFLLSQKFTVQRYLPHLNLIVKSDLNFGTKLNNLSIFSNIFTCDHHFQNLFFFEENENDLMSLIAWLIKHQISLSANDLEKFLFFLHFCPYRNQILHLVLQNTDVSIHENASFSMFALHPDTAIILFQYQVHLTSKNMFSILCKRDKYSVKYAIPYFSPSFNDLLKLKQIITHSDEDILCLIKYFEGKVKSLVEISRDVARFSIAQSCKHESSRQFLNILKHLDCPIEVKNILQCKVTVNKV